MKKKLIALCLVICLAAVAAIGGTLAYFTDTDEEVNTFTVGNVEIDLEENFTQNSVLVPGKENAVQKEVWIENTGSEEAYVWYEFYIPTILDSTDGSVGANNILHVNAYGRTWDDYRENSKYWVDGQTEALPLDKTWDHDANEEITSLVGPEGFVRTETVEGIEYNVYLALYHGKLNPNDKTSVGMSNVYLDPKVDYDVENEYYTIGGEEIEYDFSKGIEITVKAYGIQADGFDDVYAAYTAYQAQVNG